MYENQYVLINIPESKQDKRVWIKINNPIERGWLIKYNKIEKEINKKEKNIFKISKNSL